MPCNVIPDEILTDHPERFRAMIVESANPAHSLADSQRMREALAALDLVVVIDVAMTETARLADYVLPAACQFEKWEATFFNLEFPRNIFHLRHPLLDAAARHAARARDLRAARARARRGRRRRRSSRCAPRRARAARPTRRRSSTATARDPTLARCCPIVLYETLGPTLPDGWPARPRCGASPSAPR